MVRNVHERLLAVPASWLGPLLDRLGGPDDLLWPAPAWAPMVLDGPVAPGVSGSHSGIRYRVTDHRPPRPSLRQPTGSVTPCWRSRSR